MSRPALVCGMIQPIGEARADSLHAWMQTRGTNRKKLPGTNQDAGWQDSDKARHSCARSCQAAARLDGQLGGGAEAGAVQVLGAGGKVVKAILLLVQAAALPPVQPVLAAAPVPHNRILVKDNGPMWQDPACSPYTW